MTANEYLSTVIAQLTAALAKYPDLASALEQLQQALTLPAGKEKATRIAGACRLIPRSYKKGVRTALAYLKFNDSISHAAFLASEEAYDALAAKMEELRQRITEGEMNKADSN